ncbi:homoserine dehydrogenase [Luteibacter anthropi]|uniref:homoserine dehydrogenase n=1 Tax=Luteibacter anthropi TaxID=564369 RepID=UPI002033051A|nr:homoserine dehydrogenase [Luteibacter anthropi]URX60837.1 homoserine dehydrogenase [Luteibacter anthropi]
MSAVVAVPVVPVQPHTAAVLLGTGVVGRALLTLLASGAARDIRLVGAANSKRQHAAAEGVSLAEISQRLTSNREGRDNALLLAELDRSGASRKVVIDATACTTEAGRHAEWLAAGYHVVTANKALAGGHLSGWRALQAASASGAVYGDAATVGAGLPVLSTLRRLRRCGDSLLTLEGVFSGSLSWLFNQYDGSKPFSELLLDARRLGFTEPDPRSDLSGEDVARKLLIIARNAGFSLGSDEVEIESLVPEALREVDTKTFLARAKELDAPLRARHEQAKANGRVLRYLARLNQRGRARVGLVEVEASHPAARLSGTDNQFALTTTRYHATPLVIQGPGAGPEITAQALLGDVLSI